MDVKKESKKKISGLRKRVTASRKRINPFFMFLVILIVWNLLYLIFPPGIKDNASEQVSINEVFKQIKEQNVDKVVVDGTKLKIELKNGDTLFSTKEGQISFYEMLNTEGLSAGMIPSGIEESQSIKWLDVIANLALPLATLFFLWWVFRSAGKSSGGIFSIGKSRAKLFSKTSKDKIGFSDVAGANEIKKELIEVVDFLKNPDKYRKLGARIPRGILLIGPSGVGKTLLARAIAGEANVPFYSVAGSEFIEMIVGVGSARVRDLFKMAKETAPSLIFIDEIDAIGRQRGRAAAVSNDEREQTLNQILVEMDGFDVRANVIIIAATNRPDMLDPALIRPGRFDRHIKIDLPDVSEREGIIKIHMKGKPFAKTVDIKKLAKQTVGFSGADIENMLNEAAILTARRNGKEIEPKDLSEASTKVKLGPGRKKLQTEEERKLAAYHEAGHALVANKNEKADPVNRISIVSRSLSIGHTELIPKADINIQTKSNLLAKIQSLLGGRAAEDLIFKEQTVGAYGDIERATYLARIMVTDLGMSKLGPINFVSSNAGFWDARAQEKAIGYSEDIAKQIDAEVKRIIESEYEKAKKVLRNNRKTLDRLAKELLDKETLEQDDFEKIIAEDSKKSSGTTKKINPIKK